MRWMQWWKRSVSRYLYNYVAFCCDSPYFYNSFSSSYPGP